MKTKINGLNKIFTKWENSLLLKIIIFYQVKILILAISQEYFKIEKKNAHVCMINKIKMFFFEHLLKEIIDNSKN